MNAQLPLNELPDLAETPEDAHGDWGAPEADELVYRLALFCSPIPGLPDELTIGRRRSTSFVAL